MRKFGCIYIARCGKSRFYKIGFSAEPVSRLSMLQVGSPYELRFVGVFYSSDAFEIERRIQKKYAKYRKRGEWFALSTNKAQEMIDNISTQANVITITDFLLNGGSYDEFIESLDPDYLDFWEKVKATLKSNPK